jgi:hypothetical protein
VHTVTNVLIGAQELTITLRLAFSQSVHPNIDSVLGLIFRFSISVYFPLFAYMEMPSKRQEQRREGALDEAEQVARAVAGCCDRIIY